MTSSIDSLVWVNCYRLKKGPQCYEGFLEDLIPGDGSLDFEELVEDLKEPNEDRKSNVFTPLEEPDCVLTEDIYGYRFQVFGEYPTTGLETEVDAIGWVEVMNNFLDELNTIADAIFKEVDERNPTVVVSENSKFRSLRNTQMKEHMDCNEIVFLTAWWYSAGWWDSDFGLLGRVCLEDIVVRKE